MQTFTRFSFAASALGAAFLIGTSPGQAGTIGNAPWCAVQNLGAGDIIWDCEFQTVEQCQPAAIAGNRGFCNLNRPGRSTSRRRRPCGIANTTITARAWSGKVGFWFSEQIMLHLEI